MRLISTIILSFTAFISSAQLKESILSQVFTTVTPRETSSKITFGKMICCLCSPTETSCDAAKKNDTLSNQLVCKTGGINIEPARKNTSGVVIINCWGRAKDTVKKQGYICRARMLETPAEPLLVVDGVLTRFDSLGLIDPNTVETIDILKEATATAIYGHQGAKGVILITTKTGKNREFIIKDFIDGSPVPGATVSFTSIDKKDTLMFAADERGIVSTDKLDRSGMYEMKVSAAGYKSIEQPFKNSYGYKEQTFLLSRNIISCGEVFVSHTWCPKRIVFYRYANTKTEPAIIEVIEPAFKIFPNPVIKGSAFTVQLKEATESPITIRILNMEGRLMKEKVTIASKSSTITVVQTDARWAPATYIIQLVYEKGTVAASGKIVIQ